MPIAIRSRLLFPVFVCLFGCNPSTPVPTTVMTLPTMTNSLGQVYIELPGGEFDMGHDEFRPPVHRVKVSPYWIGATEVTNRQYEMLVPDHVRQPESDGDDEPATGLTRDQAEEFARLLSKKEGKRYRLPTDAEWEFAARGGLHGKNFPWGDDESDLDSKCNTGLSMKLPPAKSVMSYPPNAFGLYDMVGNVSEWVLDTDMDFPKSNKVGLNVDPLHTNDQRLWLVRGGSFMDWYPFVWFAMFAAKGTPQDAEMYSFIGFRLVISELHHDLGES